MRILPFFEAAAVGEDCSRSPLRIPLIRSLLQTRLPSRTGRRSPRCVRPNDFEPMCRCSSFLNVSLR
ncbi:hypothetical protein VTN31DRAFT_5855 [Thermomyces dupontii]|uniref:uncharacterized protein n=1 Tax=Talaromyces thermophilus TaxID=28565 RepID=UPI00374363A7